MKIAIICSNIDPISFAVSKILKHKLNFNTSKLNSIPQSYKLNLNASNEIYLCEFNKRLIEIESLDLIAMDLIIFVSRHASQKQINIFSVHALGNWSNEALLGGKPNQLSVSSPINMLKMLCILKKNNDTDIDVIYEATHHGPLLNTPSFFVEFGGNADFTASELYIQILADSIIEFINNIEYEGIKQTCEKIAIGIGGGHYALKFSNISFEKGYAFSHIMPKYYIDKIDMLDQALSKTDISAQLAVIEWKSLNSFQKQTLITKLSKLGLIYEKI